MRERDREGVRERQRERGREREGERKEGREGGRGREGEREREQAQPSCTYNIISSTIVWCHLCVDLSIRPATHQVFHDIRQRSI